MIYFILKIVGRKWEEEKKSLKKIQDKKKKEMESFSLF